MAVTRAKKKLIVVGSRNLAGINGWSHRANPSSFYRYIRSCKDTAVFLADPSMFSNELERAEKEYEKKIDESNERDVFGFTDSDRTILRQLRSRKRL
ncbi:hypothetical protein Asulf_01369 [Archaeoglobus sulfaticallidus PM70-1]|uniref:Uncharacterized protein n=1 Tax=Archaeoglobus sulfaticallidus PM70-1 TaxID=387631 RepID=N0BM65_9EURY|nr:hypothetical protein Asulf_01369 [Archaeoglobus sulfaticallidus PM70-1]